MASPRSSRSTPVARSGIAPSGSAVTDVTVGFWKFGTVRRSPQAARANDALTAATDMAFTSLRETLAPWTSPRVYQNFAERPYGAEALYGPTAATRLRAVRAAYDPDRIFVGAQSA